MASGAVSSGIEGKRAWVSGATSGLGLACAIALAREGAHVYVNGRDAERTAKAADAVRRESGGSAEPIAADLTDAADIERLRALDLRIDLLVNNNRGPKPATFDDATDEDIAEALALHFWAPLHMVRMFLPGMRQRKFGRIVSITSAMVATPRLVQFASAGARTGFTAMMEALQHEVVVDNVTINQILPERIDSPRQIQMAEDDMRRRGVTFAQARDRQRESIAAKRLGLPEEVGQACVFLCRADSGFISGMNLRLDGGSYPGLL